MDLLAQHEAFLRAIFDAPDDDTPRLVYADFLQEHGAEDRAAVIRWQCGRAEPPANVPDFPEQYERGFPKPQKATELSLDQLSDPTALRWHLVEARPVSFAVQELRLRKGRISSAEPFDVLFGLSAFVRVTELDLSGEEVLDVADTDADFIKFRLVPVITTAGVAVLAQHRGARRITALDLRYNELDNDAARALVRSPYLDNLKRLQLLEGNRFRGKVWQQVLERFGEEVVG
ncbi:TIGR02996 domain-containing protein [Frigoriglobus tundricola]|uniref:Repeat-companion domain protein n=1 Tax=Frigoriglobus tundricola TaxID=2774151 RepID=A0A6M5Z0S0_9BACT|nr:TIGR02996 domain-containing protein [Frigoriglobus tundricola]QJW99929.1 hypothetical protein FTUN_7552 [Frigoriglobus tundricola]